MEGSRLQLKLQLQSRLKLGIKSRNLSFTEFLLDCPKPNILECCLQGTQTNTACPHNLTQEDFVRIIGFKSDKRRFYMNFSSFILYFVTHSFMKLDIFPLP